MTITRSVPGAAKPILVCGGAALTVGLGVGAWMIVTPKAPEGRPVQAVSPLSTGKHFSGTVQYDLLAKLLADDRRSTPPDARVREIANPEVQAKTQAHPLLEHAAPDFTLADHRGERWSLRRQLRRGPVVLVLYLGYSCSACVHDLFELNADIDHFHLLGAEVVAISGDSPALTRQRFAEYGAFGFPVLSDPGHQVARCYGTYRPEKESEPELLLHGTFVVGRDGRVFWANSGDTPFRDNRALLYEVARLENKLPSEGSFQANAKETKR